MLFLLVLCTLLLTANDSLSRTSLFSRGNTYAGHISQVTECMSLSVTAAVLNYLPCCQTLKSAIRLLLRCRLRTTLITTFACSFFP